MTTTIFNLQVPKGSTFDQPATTTGKQWKAALSHVADSHPGDWYTIVWGRKTEYPEAIQLMFEWKSASVAEIFMQSSYEQFVELLTPIVQCPPEVSTADLNCSICEPAAVMPAGCIATVYQLPFTDLSGSKDSDLARSVREYGGSLDLDQQKGYVDATSAWSSPITNDEDAPKTLYMIARWESAEAERAAESTHAHKTLLQPVLDKADPAWQRYHVSWDMLMPEFMKWWKDSDNGRYPYKPEAK